MSTNATVYRVGPIEPGTHTGEVAALYARTDEFRPAGRVGRSDGIFASPTLFGVTRWVRGMNLIRARAVTQELRIDPADVYVYSVDAWECASTTLGRSNDALLAAYWTTGIPISEWPTAVTQQGLDPRKWEVLLPASAVRALRPVSNRRLITSIPADDWTRGELMKTIEPARWRRGTTW